MHLVQVKGDWQQPMKVRFDKRQTVPRGWEEERRGESVPLIPHAHICVIAAVQPRLLLRPHERLVMRLPR